MPSFVCEKDRWGMGLVRERERERVDCSLQRIKYMGSKQNGLQLH